MVNHHADGVTPLLDMGTGITSYLAVRTVLEFLGHICD